MTPNDFPEPESSEARTARLKEESRQKWASIVEDLQQETKHRQFGFGYRDCGYCQLYLEPEKSEHCLGCPLIQKSLCYFGNGTAYRIVSGYYRDLLYEVGPFTNREAVLIQARIMLRAIEEDIQQETERRRKETENEPGN